MLDDDQESKRGRRYTKEWRDRQAEEDKKVTEKRGRKNDEIIKRKNKVELCRLLWNEQKGREIGRRVKRQDD